jgi:hypothetical protein
LRGKQGKRKNIVGVRLSSGRNCHISNQVENPKATTKMNPDRPIKVHTYLNKRALRKLTIPPILDLRNLPLSRINLHHALNNLLHAQPLDFISRLQIHHDRVPGRSHLVMQSFDLRKGCL